MSTRDINSVLENALDDDQLTVFFAVEMFFDTETVRFWTGVGQATIDGNTYTGTGQLLGISDIEETTEIAAKGATLTLSGIPSDLLSLALSEPYQGRICKMYFGVGDPPFTSLTEVFAGYMDEMNIDEGPEYATIELKVENKLVDLERQRVRRYTSEYQKSQYPSDKGFDFVDSIQGKPVLWGRA